jgi:hypothetical protein
MFDTREQFTFSVYSGGEKKATVRFPSDEELFQRIKKFKNVRRDLGRGLSQFDVVNLEPVELETFEKIRVDGDSGGEAFDEFEAADFMSQLLSADVIDAHRNGANTFVVEMRVPNADVVHTLRMPSQRDLTEYRRESVKSLQAKRHVDVKMTLEPAVRLWDKLQAGTEGYAEGSGIPVVHKERALLEVMDLMQRLTEDSGPER